MNTHIPDFYFYIRSLSQMLTRPIPQEDPVICGTQEREEEFENSHPIPNDWNPFPLQDPKHTPHATRKLRNEPG